MRATIIGALLIAGIGMVHVFLSPDLPVAIALVGAVLIWNAMNAWRQRST